MTSEGFALSADGSLSSVNQEVLIPQLIATLLGTMCNERALYSDLGTILHEFVGKNIGKSTESDLKNEVLRVLGKDLPDLEVRGVEVFRSGKYHEHFSIHVSYFIRSINTAGQCEVEVQ